MPRPLFGLMLTLALLLAGACGADRGASTPPVEQPAILEIVASPPVTNIEHSVGLEAVIAYPEQLTELRWEACALLIDDPADSDACPLPIIPIYNAQGHWAYFSGWDLYQLSDYGASLMEALSQALGTAPEQVEPCVVPVAIAWEECVAAGEAWPDACTDIAFQGIEACIYAGGVDVMVRAVGSLEAGGEISRRRRITFAEPGAPAIGNRNPILFNLFIDGARVIMRDVIEAEPGALIEIVPNAYLDAAETYVDAEGEEVLEELGYRWVRTGGDLDFDVTWFDAPGNAFTVPVGLADPIVLWVFLEDGRGGLDYLEVAIDPVPTP